MRRYSSSGLRPASTGDAIIAAQILGRRQRLQRTLRRRFDFASVCRCAALASSIYHCSTTPQAAVVPPELNFSDVFLRTDEDVHLALLTEANRKHGVWLTVPPQRPPTIPNVGPPAIPETIFPAKLKARLLQLEQIAAAEQQNRSRNRGGGGSRTDLNAGAGLAYPAMHGPPPLDTTGTRSLLISEDTQVATVADAAPAVSSSPAAAAAAPRGGSPKAETRVTTVAKRGPVDASMQFHCKMCGRAFRREAAVKEHAIQRHLTAWTDQPGSIGSPPPSAAAVQSLIGTGPGPGEIVGFEDAVQAISTAPESSALPVSRESPPAAAGGVDPGASSAPADALPPSSAPPLTTAVASPRVQLTYAVPYNSTPAVVLPEEWLIDDLLQSVWDAVALARDDIVKPANLPKDNHTAEAATVSGQRQYDSCHGAYFIPSSLFVEGKADNRAEVEAAMATKPLARATPEGAAPGIKRRPSNHRSTAAASRQRLSLQSSGADGVLVRTAAELTIRELAKQYPNPFGDSPSAAIADIEKEKTNPFRDLESMAEALKTPPSPAQSNGNAEAGDISNSRDRLTKLIKMWSTKPFSCPLCRRAALPAADLALLAAVATGGDNSGAVTLLQDGDVVAELMSAVSCGVGGSTGSSLSAPLERQLRQLYRYNDAVPRFRLLDGLEEHLQTVCPYATATSTTTTTTPEGDYTTAAAMDAELSELHWQVLYQISANPTRWAAAEARAVAAVTDRHIDTTAAADAAAKRTTPLPSESPANRIAAPLGSAICGKDTTIDSATTTTTTTAEDEGRLAVIGSSTVPTSSGDAGEATTTMPSATSDDVECLPLHLRAATNIVLLGAVRDIQEGYIGSTYVLQYVLRVATRTTASTINKNFLPVVETRSSGDVAAAVEEAAEEEEEEYIVVRCTGDTVPAAQLRSQVRPGSVVFVSGLLRLNRCVDSTSHRSHAYPFVQVVPPLGAITVVS